MSKNRRYRAAFALATFAVAVSSCTDGNAGIAVPESGKSSNSMPDESNSHHRNVFEEIRACDVLNKALTGEDFPPGQTEKAGGENGCDSTKPQFGTVGVTLQPDQGIDDLNADPSKMFDGTIHDRPAVQIREGLDSSGDCSVAIAVGANSRALVVSSLSTSSTEEACKFITEIAEKVEPQLPKGN